MTYSKIILTFLDVPNGKKVLVKVDDALDKWGLAILIMQTLGDNPTYVMTNVTMY